MATVTEKRIVEDDEGSDDTYYVLYTFVASSESGQAEEVRRKERVSYQQFIRVPEPGQVEVIYAHSDPKVARIAAHYVPGKVSYVPVIVSGIITLIDTLIALPWTYKQFRSASRSRGRRCARHGDDSRSLRGFGFRQRLVLRRLRAARRTTDPAHCQPEDLLKC